MLRRLAAPFVLAVPLAFAIACGGAQKKAEVPDFTEKGWSGPSSEVTDTKADPPIQAASATEKKAPEATSTTTTTSATTGTESDVAAGNALPPPPKAAAKPTKAKKKTKKKKAK
jgi:hypothetical protein